MNFVCETSANLIERNNKRPSAGVPAYQKVYSALRIYF
jgi:hypothetical protein